MLKIRKHSILKSTVKFGIDLIIHVVNVEYEIWQHSITSLRLTSFAEKASLLIIGAGGLGLWALRWAKILLPSEVKIIVADTEVRLHNISIIVY